MTGARKTPEEWAAFRSWVAGMHATIRNPEYRAAQREAARNDQLKRMDSARDRRLNPDPIDRSVHFRKIGNYEFIKARGD